MSATHRDGPDHLIAEPKRSRFNGYQQRTIIVIDANARMQPIHDSMPVVLDKPDIRSWLNG
jgi:putative SOS response-associated peptidase YedK